MDGYFHVWFSTKAAREILEGDIEQDVKASIAMAAEVGGVQVIEMETAFDHVHLLLRLYGNQTLASVMHRLKGASARSVLMNNPELAMHSEQRHLWQRGYGWRRVPSKQLQAVRHYIRTQQNRPHRPY